MFCRTIEMRDHFQYLGLAHHLNAAAIELDNLSRGVGYRDGEIQDLVKYLDEEIFEDHALGKWSEYCDLLYERLELPKIDEHQHYKTYYKKQLEGLKEYLFPALRNVGSRGPKHAKEMMHMVIKMSRLAMAMTTSRGGCF